MGFTHLANLDGFSQGNPKSRFKGGFLGKLESRINSNLTGLIILVLCPCVFFGLP